jgi:hypothetical protein
MGTEVKSEGRYPKSERNPKTEGRISGLAWDFTLTLLGRCETRFGFRGFGPRISGCQSEKNFSRCAVGRNTMAPNPLTSKPALPRKHPQGLESFIAV